MTSRERVQEADKLVNRIILYTRLCVECNRRVKDYTERCDLLKSRVAGERLKILKYNVDIEKEENFIKSYTEEIKECQESLQALLSFDDSQDDETTSDEEDK